MQWEVSGEEFKESKEFRWDVLRFGKVRCEGEETTPFAAKGAHVNAVERRGTATSDIAEGEEAEDERIVDWFVYLVDVTRRRY
jgi:hypothetical protein